LFTALVLSFPLVWLANHEFAGGGVIRAVFGTDQVSYWRCVGLFAIWHIARVRIKLSGPAQIKIEGLDEWRRWREEAHAVTASLTAACDWFY
jgi:hypothetical protein